MELTLQNVTSGHSGGNVSELSVHFLRSCDGYMYGLCFKKPNGNACETLWYGPRDARGAISALVPPEKVYTPTVDRMWDTKSIVRKDKRLDYSLWSESAYMYTITSTQYIDYQKWAVEWAAAAGQYSVIEGGNTSREFMTASVEHFSAVGKPVFVLKQSVTTLSLEYDNKEPVSLMDSNDAAKWFNALHNSYLFSNVPRVGDVEAFVRFVTNGSLMYYREKVGGVTKMWKLTGARIRPHTAPLHHVESYPLQVEETLLVNLPPQLPPTVHPITAQQMAQAAVTQVSSDPVTPPVTPPLSDNITLIIVLVVVIIVIIIVVALYMWHSNSTPPAETVITTQSMLPQNSIVMTPTG